MGSPRRLATTSPSSPPSTPLSPLPTPSPSRPALTSPSLFPVSPAPTCPRRSASPSLRSRMTSVIAKCITQLAAPACQNVELTLPKQVCKEINYGYAEDTHEVEPVTYAPAPTYAPATYAPIAAEE